MRRRGDSHCRKQFAPASEAQYRHAWQTVAWSSTACAAEFKHGSRQTRRVEQDTGSTAGPNDGACCSTCPHGALLAATIMASAQQGEEQRERAGRRWRAHFSSGRRDASLAMRAGSMRAMLRAVPDAASRGSAPGQSKICALRGLGHPRVPHKPVTRPGPLWTAGSEARATARSRCGRPAPAPRASGFRPGSALRSTRRSAWLRRRRTAAQVPMRRSTARRRRNGQRAAAGQGSCCKRLPLTQARLARGARDRRRGSSAER